MVIGILKEFVQWEGRNFFKNYCCILSQSQIDPDLRFYNHVLALSFKDKEKNFSLMVFMLQFKSL
jgi:hypothetical protein